MNIKLLFAALAFAAFTPAATARNDRQVTVHDLRLASDEVIDLP